MQYIYEIKELALEDKYIAESIINLCKNEWYCWITNKTLSEMNYIIIDIVSKYIRKLE